MKLLRVRSVVLLAALAALGVAAASAAKPLHSKAKASDGATAEQMLKAAEAQARAEHKNVLVDFSASWCVNCKLFDRFWDDPQIHPIMDGAFVRVTLDAGERPSDALHHDTPGAMELMARLFGPGTGYPSMAILAPDGRVIVTTLRDVQGSPEQRNIGYPVAPQEIDWFMHMMAEGAPALSPQQDAVVRAWLQKVAAGILA